MDKMMIKLIQADGSIRTVILEARPCGVLVLSCGYDSVRVQMGYNDQLLSVSSEHGCHLAPSRINLSSTALVVDGGATR
jgi:hypothetical protein